MLCQFEALGAVDVWSSVGGGVVAVSADYAAHVYSKHSILSFVTVEMVLEQWSVAICRYLSAKRQPPLSPCCLRNSFAASVRTGRRMAIRSISVLLVL